MTKDEIMWSDKQCVKSVRIRCYSGPHFPVFGLNTERYRVFSDKTRVMIRVIHK